MIKKILNANPHKLHQELIDAGINLVDVKHDEIGEDYKSKNTWITLENESNMELVQQIIDTHNPTPLPTVDPEEVLKAEIELVTINTLIDLEVI